MCRKIGCRACVVVVVPCNLLLYFFFFFQAEDGIRDVAVMEFRRVLFRSGNRFPMAAQGRRLVPELSVKVIIEAENRASQELGPCRSAPVPVSAWSWLPAREWCCIFCGLILVTREIAPRCGRCGFREGT